MTQQVLEETVIEGLEWRENYVAASPEADNHYYLIANEASGIADMLFFIDEGEPSWMGLHVGQTDLLTFFGPPNKTILGSFIDCREGSSTLHRRIDLLFHPDPTRHLFIDRGVAHNFVGVKNVTIRVENIWYMSEENLDYELANDSINFRADEDPNNFPTVRINDLPVPEEAFRYILAEQQRAIRDDRFGSFSTRGVLGGEQRRVRLERR